MIVDDKQIPHVLDAIKLVGGLAEYVIPMPDGIRNTTSPVDIVDDDKADGVQKITQAEADRRMREYGALDWYEWALENWGTKWGTYDHEWDEGTMILHFQTAWSPMNDEVLKRLGNFFRGAKLHMEEESGEFNYSVTL